MKTFAFAAALALSMASAYSAEPPTWEAGGMLEPSAPGSPADCQSGNSRLACANLPDAAAGMPAPRADSPAPPRTEPVAFIVNIPMSTIPEPEVFAMMLLGLCLIGFRASRDSDEKFK